MSRELTSDIINELRKPYVQIVWLAKIEFVGLDVYLSTRRGDISWDGQTWLGNGILQAPRAIAATKDHNSNGMELPLTGYDQTFMSLILNSINHSKKLYLYFGMISESDTLIPSPFKVFEGRFDTAKIQSTGLERSMTLSYENDFMVVKRVNAFRYTDQGQQAYFPGDTGFQRVAQTADSKLWWGASKRPRTMQTKKRNTAK